MVLLKGRGWTVHPLSLFSFVIEIICSVMWMNFPPMLNVHALYGEAFGQNYYRPYIRSSLFFLPKAVPRSFILCSCKHHSSFIPLTPHKCRELTNSQPRTTRISALPSPRIPARSSPTSTTRSSSLQPSPHYPSPSHLNPFNLQPLPSIPLHHHQPPHSPPQPPHHPRIQAHHNAHPHPNPRPSRARQTRACASPSPRPFERQIQSRFPPRLVRHHRRRRSCCSRSE